MKKATVFLIALCVLMAAACGVLVLKGGYVTRFLRRGEPYDYHSNAQYGRKVTVFNALNYPDGVDILMLGDSLTDYADWNALFPEYTVVNQGICDDTTEGMLNRLDAAVKCDPKNVFICIGYNDLRKGVPLEDEIRNYEAIFDRLGKELPDARIFVAPVLPGDTNNSAHIPNTRVDEVNARLHALPLPENARFIEIEGIIPDKPGVHVEDGLHLTGETYLMVADQLRAYLQ